MRYCLIIPGVVDVSGYPYAFCSHSSYPTPVTVTPIYDAITAVGAMTSTLDPVEAVIDSGAISISLALDTGVGDVFSRSPGVFGRMTASRLPNSSIIKFSSAASVTATTLCIGVSTYSYSQSSYSSRVSSGTITLAALSQESYQYFDSDIQMGAEVSLYPTQWKGRLAYLYITDPITAAWRLYRVCALAGNPTRTLSELQLTLTPLDTRIRDVHVSSPLDTVAKLSSSTRTYAGSRVNHVFAEAYIGQSATYLPAWSSDTFTLTSPSSMYSALYGTLQPVTTDPAGRHLGLPSQDICTPCCPPVTLSQTNSTSGNIPRLLGRSGSTAYASVTPAADSRLSIEPTARWYVTSGSTLTALYNRSATRASSPSTSAEAEPIIRLQAYGSQSNAQGIYYVNAYPSSPSVTCTPVPTYLGLMWEETVDEVQQRPSDAQIDNTGHAFRRDIGVKAQAWSWETTQNWQQLCEDNDLYSWKIVDPEITSAISARRVNATKQWREAKGIDHRCGWAPLQTWSQIQIAFARFWWERGEAQLCLDTQYCAVGESLWLTAHWTEDGQTFHDRRLKLQMYSIPATGVYMYTVLRSPRCAGIGDWFGHSATFTPDRTIEAEEDGHLLFLYLSQSLRLPLATIDSPSLYLYGIPSAVDVYSYETPEDYAESMSGLMAMSGTCISFGFDQGDYRITRKWSGMADKAGSYIDITDDDLLSVPVVSRDDHVVSTYEVKLPEGDVTYVDRVAQDLFADSDDITIDLSTSEVSDGSIMSMRGALQNMVYRLGSERLTYSTAIPYEKGYLLAPGDLVRLTSALTVGVDTSLPPSQQMTRVVGVTQDPVGYRTELTLQAVETGAAHYQQGSIVTALSSDYKTLYLDDTSWITVGMTVYHAAGSTTVSAVTSTYITVNTGYMVTAIWRAAEQDRFIMATDRLG